ncbi:hypothetical protein [Streptomyces gilvus]|nr:hypothetical protein [Streptomyces sp. CME 23]MCH5670999.1 hypothetical protein [Streptomyces sp. CME 23]
MRRPQRAATDPPRGGERAGASTTVTGSPSATDVGRREVGGVAFGH